MTEKSEDRGSNQSQNQNAAGAILSSTQPRILPQVDPAKTINLIQEGHDPKTKSAKNSHA